MGESYREDPYEVYVKTYGKVRSGHSLEDNDYRGRVIGGKGITKEYDLPRRLAVSLAANDAKSPYMRTKSDFEEELKRLLESPPSQDTGVTYERDS
ncbi:hypothetical protein KAX02_12315 [candidate division WOR-3 bacterium]|nr:hypothetical protein [candidate division WOR-3 bacterium]